MRSIKGIIIGFLLILLGFAVTSYSLIAGGVLAYLVMCLTIRRLPERLLWVVSVLAAFGHNAGQLLVAVWVTGTPSILVYAPALVAASVITGAFTGVAAMYLVRALRKTGHFPQA